MSKAHEKQANKKNFFPEDTFKTGLLRLPSLWIHPVDTNPPGSVEDRSSIPGPGRSHMPWSSYACGPQVLRLCSGAGEPEPASPEAAATEIQAP